MRYAPQETAVSAAPHVLLTKGFYPESCTDWISSTIPNQARWSSALGHEIATEDEVVLQQLLLWSADHLPTSRSTARSKTVFKIAAAQKSAPHHRKNNEDHDVRPGKGRKALKKKKALKGLEKAFKKALKRP